MARACIVCGKRAYSDYCMQHKPKKRLPMQSAKEKVYQLDKEEMIRPAIIERDGNQCWCCGRPAYPSEKLDLEHQLTKGSRPDLKRDINNIRLYCRIPCHSNKTDGKPCKH